LDPIRRKALFRSQSALPTVGSEEPHSDPQPGQPEEAEEESLGKTESAATFPLLSHRGIMANGPQGGKRKPGDEPSAYSRRSASWRALFTA
jgi:hypothetical protein